MRYDGTQATLRGRFGYGHGDTIEIHDHLTERIEQVDIQAGASGHGGGDEGIMAAFVQALRNPGAAMTTARQSLESHLMAFAAEEARVEGSLLSMEEYRRRVESR
jgi:hypothetical protein